MLFQTHFLQKKSCFCSVIRETINQFCPFTEFHIHKVHHQLWVHPANILRYILALVFSMWQYGSWSWKHLHILPVLCRSERKTCCWARTCLNKHYKRYLFLYSYVSGLYGKDKALKSSPFPAILLHAHLQKQSGSCLLIPLPPVAHPPLFF